jgi:replicative DNA helicase
VVIFINRKNRALQTAAGQEEAEEEDWRLADIIIAKQRNGPTDMFRLVFLEEFTRFENPEFARDER